MIKKLKETKRISIKSFTGTIFWLLRSIILDHEKRIQDLDYRIALLEGGVEPDIKEDNMYMNTKKSTEDE